MFVSAVIEKYTDVYRKRAVDEEWWLEADDSCPSLFALPVSWHLMSGVM